MQKPTDQGSRPNYAYWQNEGRWWHTEYPRRMATDPLYPIQTIVLSALFSNSSPAKIAEFGCGTGRHLAYLKQIEGIDVHGIDQSPTMVEAIRLNSDPIRFAEHVTIVDPVGVLPFPDDAFDIVFTCEALIHVSPDDLGGRLKELIRIARLGVFHLEPRNGYQIHEDAHFGSWNHDLVKYYSSIGVTAFELTAPCVSQNPVFMTKRDQWRPKLSNVFLDQCATAEKCIMNLSQSSAVTAAAFSKPDDDKQIGENMSSERQISIYPTQFIEPARKLDTLGMENCAGAPFAPLPRSFYLVDRRLDVCQDLPSSDEVSQVLKFREKFRLGTYATPYVDDILRAFRLLNGKQVYLEIGIFDRGNLAFASSLLADSGLLVGVDIQEDAVRDGLLRASLKDQQTYKCVVGSSRSPQTVEQVREALNGRTVDVLFIDGDHTAFGAMCDYALYEEFMAPDGIILFHDSVWEGDETYKGVCDALAEIDKCDPVYLIDGSNPCRRFVRPLWRDALWGVVGVVFVSDQLWRRDKIKPVR